MRLAEWLVRIALAQLLVGCTWIAVASGQSRFGPETRTSSAGTNSSYTLDAYRLDGLTDRLQQLEGFRLDARVSVLESTLNKLATDLPSQRRELMDSIEQLRSFIWGIMGTLVINLVATLVQIRAVRRNGK